MAATVQLKQIEKRYNDATILHAVSLDIQSGEFMTLVGPSGCGKSTMLRVIAGLLPQSGGSVKINGAGVDHLRPKERDIAMVFQSYALYPHMTVRGNIATPLAVQHLPRMARLPLIGQLVPGQKQQRETIQSEVQRVAKLVEIEDLLDRKPAALSGGQRQRVALARAIIRNPQVFLMDEPLSNLDARLRVSMRSEIVALHKRLGATFIYVTHDQTEAMTMSSRVAVMMDGHIVQCATPKELYDAPSDLRVARFIGSPEINVVASDDIATWDLPNGVIASMLQSPLHIAFRPEAITLGSKQGAIQTICSIERFEELGHDVLLFLKTHTGGIGLTARLSAEEFAQLKSIGDALPISIDPVRLLVFGPDGVRREVEELTSRRSISNVS